MAIFFGKKKSEQGKDGDGKPQTAPVGGPGNGGIAPPVASGGGASEGTFEYSPEKGKKWFDHARVSHEAGNFEYAMTCWLSGLRFDPGNLESVKAFTASARAYTDQNRKWSTRETQKALTGRTDVDKYLLALLEWACRPTDASSAIEAVAGAAKIALTDISRWMLPTALKVALLEAKPRKSNLVKLMEIAEKQGQFDLAVQAGEAAYKLDPADNKLSAYIRNLAAQATMDRGGYERTGEAGGFRQNIRDSDRQRLLDDADKLSRTEGATDRLIAAAKEEYQANPQDKPTIRKLAKFMLERGGPGDDRI